MTDQESCVKKTARRSRMADKAAQLEQACKDRGLVADAMRGILGDQGATAREKIFAALTLDHITGGLVPWRAGQLIHDSNNTNIADFARAVDAIAAANS